MVAPGGSSGTLRMDGPYPVHPSALDALARQGRMHHVTLPYLLDVGAAR